MRSFYFILFWFIPITTVFAQNAIVTFTPDKDCEVFIYKPIDGGYNEKVSDIRLVSTNIQPVSYEIEVSSFMFIFCQFPQYQKSCNILLFPNDSIKVHLSTDDITFQGNNQVGQQYLYENFDKYPDLDNYIKMQDVFTEYIDNKRDIHTVLPTVDERRGVSNHISTIEALPLKANVTTEFANVLKTEIHMFFNSDIIALFLQLLSKHQRNKVIPPNDSIAIRKQVDSIFKAIPISHELLGYPARILYVSKYSDFYYRDQGCPEGYDPDTFGPYMTYLYAPKKMQSALLGNACMVQLKYDTGEMNLSKLKKFFNEEFPDSEYTAIINEKVKEENDSVDEFSADQIFIKEKIDSLSQLKDVEELKGKYLYIDLWASWCMPCRAEFSHKDKVEEILSTYKDAVTLYVSIDLKNQEKAWNNCIKSYKLAGFHLRASSNLQQDIQKKVYGTDNYEIPRYILISPTGEILHKDLPRPSNYPELKEVLDGIMK
ncbi:TlpA family protein disulfide reductase [Bacteroides sp. UBA939]|uniref:TlpA family protein disulfide reductase n=1 Tax=Bacteroides sp. UBA939 TaxID=1946092 RepID=UPI0025C6E433|nr:thioredoxin-like domain-containing protein [Bacteroides sp. UBA939]